MTEKVKVRIAVCVADDGEWGANGAKGTDERDLMHSAWESATWKAASETLNVKQYWVEVWLEKPDDPQVINDGITVDE